MSEPLLLFFLALALTLFLPALALAFGLGGTLAYYAVRWRLLGSAFALTRVNLYILILLCGVLLGLVVTPAPLLSAVSVAKLLAGISIFYILIDFIRTPADAWRVTAGLVAVGIGLAVLIPFDVQWSPDKVYPLPFLAEFNPPTAGINPNLVAGVLAVVLPLAASLMFAKRWRVLGAVALVPLILGLIVLQSRGALFGLVAGLTLSATALRKWLLPLLLLVVLAGAGANYFWGGASLAPYVLGRRGTATSGTTLERVALWRQAFDLLGSHPLSGLGFGAYPSVAPYAPPYSPSSPGPSEPHAHNLFLQVGLDTGLPGLVGFVLILLWAMGSAWGAHARGFVSPLALGVLAALGVVAVNGLVDSVLWGFKSGVTIWVLFALALALVRLEQRQEPARSEVAS